MDDATLQSIRERDEAWIGTSLINMPEIARERRVLLAEVDRLRDGITRHRAQTQDRLNQPYNIGHEGNPIATATSADLALWALIGDDDA